MSLGWFDDLSDANDYFESERLETSAWDALTDDKKKSAAVTMAYNRIYYDPRYNVPTYANATASQLIILKKVNGEMAYYLAQHLADEDRRKGLEAQGVTDAGIVKEKYSKDDLMSLPVPPFVDTLLNDFKTAKAFGVVDIDRDEDEKADEDVVDL